MFAPSRNAAQYLPARLVSPLVEEDNRVRHDASEPRGGVGVSPARDESSAPESNPKRPTHTSGGDLYSLGSLPVPPKSKVLYD